MRTPAVESPNVRCDRERFAPSDNDNVPSTHSRVPFLDLQAQYSTIRDEVIREVFRVIESQRFILGEDVQELEKDIAAYCGCSFAVGCASGSDALLLALKALDIGRGDEVLTTPYTFFATAGAIHHAGAKPVFVDIDPATFNLDVGQLDSALSAHSGIRAIIPVHLFGGCAEMNPILNTAWDRGIAVIEDAAQAIGAEYNGRRAGSMGAIGCFSFFPSKNLGAYGDGGMLTTNDANLADKLRILRVHGGRSKYLHEEIGWNSRLDALQAAVLRVKLGHLDDWSSSRNRNADLYRQHLSQAPLRLPVPASYQTRHIFNQFVIRTAGRDELKQHLSALQVGTEIYYPLPLHLQPCFSYLGYRKGDFPIAEQLAVESLALPVYAELGPEQIEYVSSEIRGFLKDMGAPDGAMA